MAKQNLKDLMAKRNPLFQTEREAVQPADLYTSPQVDKTTSRETDKETKPQVSKTTKQQTDKTSSREGVKTETQKIEKYTTHLRHETIREIKREAVESERKDYEIVQEALNKYFKAKKGAGG